MHTPRCSPQGNAPAGICIVLRPFTTGEVSKWEIISVPLKTVTEFAGVPFTMKTLPSQPPPGALRLTVKSVGGVPATMLPHGGELLVTHNPRVTVLELEAQSQLVWERQSALRCCCCRCRCWDGRGKAEISIELSGVTPSLAWPPASQM